MKKMIIKFLRKALEKLNPPFRNIKNYDTYYAVCRPSPYGVIGVDYDLMVKEISKRTGIDLDICEKVYSAEDDILTEIGIIN
ncbi:MAG: hypothetical protein K6C34_00820 [Alphaproteobacteria bacterium]|nr:hypothetical protein [Alphaproteobacteria bacterium]